MKRACGLLALTILLSGTSGVALADPGRISRGEAQAVLQARGTGGGAIRNHGGSNGAPADLNGQVAIRPQFEDGRHYCVLDWHVISLALIAEDLSLQQMKAESAAVSLEFAVDGVPIDTRRLPVKRFLDRSIVEDKGFFYAESGLVAPGELAVGSHTLSLVAMNLADPGDPSTNFIESSQFFIDAEGTGTCL